MGGVREATELRIQMKMSCFCSYFPQDRQDSMQPERCWSVQKHGFRIQEGFHVCSSRKERESFLPGDQLQLARFWLQPQLDQKDLASGAFQGTWSWDKGDWEAHTKCLEFDPRPIKCPPEL